MQNWGNTSCNAEPGSGWENRLRSECVWIQYWVELPTAADAARFRAFLANYASEQHGAGRFKFVPPTQLRDVRGWLTYEHVVMDETRILVLVSLSFLFVCLLNAMGLMLAKIIGRSADISVRRALGATRGAIFAQCLMESLVVGAAGACVGLGLTFLGTVGLRHLLSDDVAALTHPDLIDVTLAVAFAVAATVLAGLYPTWRATRLQPAWQLKAQ
jgi:putative ABC transport system permease protein